MTNIEALQDLVKKFCEDRDWDQFHSPKDLAIGLTTEASELLELFRFKTDLEVNELLKTENFKEKLRDEAADVFFFLLRICQMNNIDLDDSFKKKLIKNAEKYPIEKSKGSNKKYNE